MTFRILVCGGRDYTDREAMYRVLDNMCLHYAERGPMLVIEGGARGADTLARNWAEERAVECWTFHANWKRDGRAAGPKRNQWMLDQRPDLVLAFPGGKGTGDMIRRASKAGVKLAICDPELNKYVVETA